eukprot:1161964-Pelagomonas_calceolata.AAC.5
MVQSGGISANMYPEAVHTPAKYHQLPPLTIKLMLSPTANFSSMDLRADHWEFRVTECAKLPVP